MTKLKTIVVGRSNFDGCKCDVSIKKGNIVFTINPDWIKRFIRIGGTNINYGYKGFMFRIDKLKNKYPEADIGAMALYFEYCDMPIKKIIPDGTNNLLIVI